MGDARTIDYVYDDLGRLETKSYDGSLHEDSFDGDELPQGWNWSGSVWASGGQAHLWAYPPLWSSLWRTESLRDGQAARFVFRLDSADADGTKHAELR